MSKDARKSRQEPRLFRFDESDAELSLLPLSSRRALDCAGIKLSLASYQKLSVADRVELALMGSREDVDVSNVQTISKRAGRTETIAKIGDPNPHRPPTALLDTLGSDRPVPEKVWQGLSSLERYALVKVANKNRPERIDACYAEIIGAQKVSTHLKPGGGVRMVSIAKKEESHRRARAEAWVTMSKDAYQRLVSSQVPKGDVLGTARLAGIMATKKTADLIPLCHPLALQHADVDFEMNAKKFQVRIVCTAEVFGRTGVEMEAMAGASTAALTIYDMLKSLDRALCIGPIRLIEKSGGRSGLFVQAPASLGDSHDE